MMLSTKRCASKDWPYEDGAPMYLPGPGYYWECPDGTCECRPPEESDPRDLTVLLCDELGRPIPNARCRVLHGGHVLNEGAPNADAEGWLRVTVTRVVRTVTLEWAPPDTPLGPRFPYRWRYHVDLEEEASDRHSPIRRLHNLGFSRHGVLEENVKEFQRTFGYDEITGDPEDIREDLLQFHDEGGIPPLDGEGEESEDPGPEPNRMPLAAFPGERVAARDNVSKKKGKKPAVPRKAPPPKNKPAGGGRTGKGTVRPRSRGKLRLRVRSLFAQPATAAATSCRWDGHDSHPVAGARVELFDAEMNEVPAFAVNKGPRTDANGRVTLLVGNLPDGEYVLKLSPPEGHALRPVPAGAIRDEAAREALLRPVGPLDVFLDDPANHTRFRFLEIRIRIKKGVMDGRETRLGKGMLHPDAIVAHGAAVGESESSLQIDWKPDWVRCGFVGGPKRPQRIPNDPRADGEPEERLLSPMTFIVLHHAEADTPGSVISEFLGSAHGTDPKGVHYLVDVDGHVIKMTHESMRAPHAGKCFWYGLESSPSSEGFNWADISVGIEQVHKGTKRYPSELVAGTKNLIQRVRAAFSTSHHNVIGHGEIAIHELAKDVKTLGRKVLCPGEHYNWPFLESSGNATRPASGSRVGVPHARYGDFFVRFPFESINTFKGDRAIVRAAVAGMQVTLSQLGYLVSFTGQYDERTARAVEAFQVRYFSGETRQAERKQIMVGRNRLANLVTIRRMHEVLEARGSFRF